MKYKVAVALIKIVEVEVDGDEIVANKNGPDGGWRSGLFARAKSRVLENEYGLYDRVEIDGWAASDD